MGQDFETGLCACFSDCETCLCAFCLPCVQFGRNAHPLLPCSDCFLCGIFFFVGGMSHCLLLQNRILIRNEYGYEVMFCSPCVIAQEGRVLKAKK